MNERNNIKNKFTSEILDHTIASEEDDEIKSIFFSLQNSN